ncbi:MAG: ribosome biogenesis factor YjgA [Rudaea sp.]
MQPAEYELNQPDAEGGEQAPSRSQLRSEALDVLKLAHTLADLSDAQLARVPLPEDIREEIQRARAVKQQIARKRQTQFLAKQLRKLDDAEIEPIRAALEHDKDHARRETALLHQLESEREHLLSGGDDALNALVAEYPHADRQHLRQLMRQAHAEREQNRPAHAYRELFRMLRELTGE